MPSEINRLNGSASVVGVSAPMSGKAGAAAAAAAGTAASDSAAASAGDSQVQITGSASLLATIAQHLQSLPAVNDARVAHLRSAIDSGSYTVQSGVVADRLLQSEQMLAQIGGG